MKHYYTVIESPVGDITLISDSDSLCAIYWPNQKPDERKFPGLEKSENNKLLRSAAKQLNSYFEGNRKVFDLPLNPVGTNFQEKVWKALTTIEYGETVSYTYIAGRINNPKAVRAVGAWSVRAGPIAICS